MVGRDTLTAPLTDLLGVDPHTMLYGMLVWLPEKPFEVAGGRAERGYQFCYRHPRTSAATGLMVAVQKKGHTALPPVACLSSTATADCSLSFSSEADI